MFFHFYNDNDDEMMILFLISIENWFGYNAMLYYSGFLSILSIL